MSATLDNAREVHITREFNVPRDRVFAAWLDAAQLAQWYAPHGCAIRFQALDPRPGGHYHSCITTPDGHECWCIGEYREINPPARIVLTMAVANAQGMRMSPSDVGMDPAWPAETVLTLDFEDLGGATRLTLRQTVDQDLAIRTGAHPSWLQMLDRLADLLA